MIFIEKFWKNFSKKNFYIFKIVQNDISGRPQLGVFPHHIIPETFAGNYLSFDRRHFANWNSFQTKSRNKKTKNDESFHFFFLSNLMKSLWKVYEKSKVEENNEKNGKSTRFIIFGDESWRIHWRKFPLIWSFLLDFFRFFSILRRFCDICSTFTWTLIKIFIKILIKFLI